MKTQQVFFTLSCLLLLVIAGQPDVVRAQESPQVQQDRERHKNNLRSAWDRGGVIMSSGSLLRDPAFRAALGVSDEDYQAILASAQNARGHISENPEFQEARREQREAFRAVWGREPGGNWIMLSQEIEERERNAGPEAINRLQVADEKLDSVWREFALGADQREVVAFEDALSPELKQKMLEAQLAAMGESSTISPRLFEALNLTDAQKEGMERIKKELEPEFENHAEIFSNNAAKILERVDAARERHQRHASDFSFGRRGDAPPEDWRTVLRNLQDEPEHRRLLDESYASSKAFAELFRTRMLDILTDEQRSRLQGLLNNPPPHARLLIQRLRREQWGQHEDGEREGAAGVDREIWVPGPDAWRPGDPVPVQLEERERSRFPQDE